MVKTFSKGLKRIYDKSVPLNPDDVVEAKKVISKFSEEKTKEEIFYNLCFAIIAPQAKYSNMLKAISELKEIDFYKKKIEINDLVKICSLVRFKNKKAMFLEQMKEKFEIIFTEISDSKINSEVYWLRDFIVREVNGIGLKATSHFLRNIGIGFDEFSIIDTHIFKFLNIEKKSLNSKEYKELELEFIQIAKTVKLSPAVLDALVWKFYSKTKWTDFIY